MLAFEQQGGWSCPNTNHEKHPPMNLYRTYTELAFSLFLTSQYCVFLSISVLYVSLSFSLALAFRSVGLSVVFSLQACCVVGRRANWTRFSFSCSDICRYFDLVYLASSPLPAPLAPFVLSLCFVLFVFRVVELRCDERIGFCDGTVAWLSRITEEKSPCRRLETSWGIARKRRRERERTTKRTTMKHGRRARCGWCTREWEQDEHGRKKRGRRK